MVDVSASTDAGHSQALDAPSHTPGVNEMTMVVVPNSLRDAIMKKLDAEIAKHPDAEKDREVLYSQLLGYFD